MIKFANLLQVNRRLWQFELHIFHRVCNNLRDGKIPEPLVVRWDDEPWRMFGRTLRQNRLESVNVTVPELAFGIIAVADFPLPAGIVEAFLKTRQLLILGDVQKELKNSGVLIVYQEL